MHVACRVPSQRTPCDRPACGEQRNYSRRSKITLTPYYPRFHAAAGVELAVSRPNFWTRRIPATRAASLQRHAPRHRDSKRARKPTGLSQNTASSRRRVRRLGPARSTSRVFRQACVSRALCRRVHSAPSHHRTTVHSRTCAADSTGRRACTSIRWWRLQHLGGLPLPCTYARRLRASTVHRAAAGRFTP